MRISIITNGFQEGYIIDLVNGLARVSEANQIQLIGSADYHKKNIDKKVRIIDISDRPAGTSLYQKVIRNSLYYLRLFGTISRKNTDIVHIQWLNLIVIDGIMLPLLLRLSRIKVCYTAHDVLPHSQDNILNRILFYLIYRIPHEILVHTDFIKTRLIKEFGTDPKKITVINHGIYTVENDNDIDEQGARQMLGLTGDNFVILFFGIITKYKGLDLLMGAFSELQKEIRQIRLVIAGKVDPKYQQDFDDLILKYKRDEIKVFPGYIDDHKIQIYFKAADCTILPYLEASQSGVMFMSYTFGKPVIAPALGGFCRDIQPGKTGYLFKPGDRESLYNAIIQLNREMDYKSTRNREFIQTYSADNYSWKKTGIEICRIYSK